MTRELIAAVLLAAAASHVHGDDTSYGAELASLDERLAVAETAGHRTEALHLLYSRASLTGELDDWLDLWRRVAAAPESPEQLLYWATTAVELHKLDLALAALDRLDETFPGFADRNPSYPRLLRADVALQRGRDDEAARTYDLLLAEERSWDRLARVANVARRSGQSRRADRLYAEAQEPLSVQEMRRWAWLEMQRGLVDLDRQRHARALEHFQRADRAYSGYWLAEEHLAEALAKSGRIAEAIEIYRQVIKESSRPEYLAALADLVAESGPAEAARLHRLALERFERHFEQAPEAVAGTFADYLLRYDPADPRLPDLADLDFQLRPNAEARRRLDQVPRQAATAPETRRFSRCGL